MRGKFLFFLGLGIGYVFGTRAGRRRYEQIKAAAKNIWASEPVQWSVSQAQEAVGDVADEVLTAAKRVIQQVSGDKPKPKKAAKRPTKSANASTARAAAAPARSAARVTASAAARPVTKPVPTGEPAARKSTPQPAPEA